MSELSRRQARCECVCHRPYVNRGSDGARVGNAVIVLTHDAIEPRCALSWRSGGGRALRWLRSKEVPTTAPNSIRPCRCERFGKMAATRGSRACRRAVRARRKHARSQYRQRRGSRSSRSPLAVIPSPVRPRFPLGMRNSAERRWRSNRGPKRPSARRGPYPSGTRTSSSVHNTHTATVSLIG